jgi:hypothetical protein
VKYDFLKVEEEKLKKKSTNTICNK